MDLRTRLLTCHRRYTLTIYATTHWTRPMPELDGSYESEIARMAANVYAGLLFVPNQYCRADDRTAVAQ